MADPCATPGTTPPATSALTTGLTGLFQKLIRTDQPESTKRALAILAGVTLCLCTFGLTLAVEYQAAHAEGHVDGQLVLALLGVGAWTAALAGVAYRKQEDPQ